MGWGMTCPLQAASTTTTRTTVPQIMINIIFSLYSSGMNSAAWFPPVTATVPAPLHCTSLSVATTRSSISHRVTRGAQGKPRPTGWVQIGQSRDPILLVICAVKKFWLFFLNALEIELDINSNERWIWKIHVYSRKVLLPDFDIVF